MASLQPGGLQVLGRISNLIVYQRYDMPGRTLVRERKGIDSNRLKESETFVNTRRCSSEFGGRAAASRHIMSALHDLKKLANYNVAGPLNARMKPIQEMDLVNEWGQRSVLLSKQPGLLEGFNFNQDKYLFDSVVKNPVRFTITKDQLSARIEIPALIPGINFNVEGRFPLYSLVATLGFVPDMIFTPFGYKGANDDHHFTNTAYSEWYPVLNGSPTITLAPAIPGYTPPNESFVLLLGIGIRYGTPGADGQVRQLKRAGSAKIIGVV